MFVDKRLDYIDFLNKITIKIKNILKETTVIFIYRRRHKTKTLAKVFTGLPDRRGLTVLVVTEKVWLEWFRVCRISDLVGWIYFDENEKITSDERQKDFESFSNMKVKKLSYGEPKYPNFFLDNRRRESKDKYPTLIVKLVR